MGIDIYMNWDKQSEDEKQGQYTGFSIEHGFAGYLREAYHGGIFATQHLVAEAFDNDAPEEGVAIPFNVLRERLPETLKLHIQRHKETYGEDVKEDDPSAKAFTDFVELAERLTQEHKHPTIIASW